MRHRCFIVRFGFVILAGLNALPGSAGQSQTASKTDSAPARRACACADGRQFSIGSSLFGKGSARVVIKDFHADPAQILPTTPLPACHDLTVVGQVVGLKTASDRPFLQRETLKRGTIQNICQTKIQFVEPKKSYDFFADDGSAVTLSDVDTGQEMPPSGDTDASKDGEGKDEGSPDLTGKDLIQLIPREQGGSDPSASTFDGDDLKDGAYCIVRRQVKALPAIDDNSDNTNAQKQPVTVWAGTLGRIEKRAGFRSEPLWVVELLPHSAPLSFSRSLGLLVETLHRNHPFAKNVVLPANDIVEINHFFDQYGVEWTRFGATSEEVQAQEALGTTVLPDLYGPPKLTLEENLSNAQKTHIFEAVQKAALRLVFVPKNSGNLNNRETLILDEETSPASLVEAVPHLSRQQCFLGASGTLKPQDLLRVSDVDIRVFQPRDSAQVPDDYYAIDLKLQLRSDSNSSNVPLVCRFPLAAIDINLLGKAERILSSQFEIRRREVK